MLAYISRYDHGILITGLRLLSVARGNFMNSIICTVMLSALNQASV